MNKKWKTRETLLIKYEAGISGQIFPPVEECNCPGGNPPGQ